MKYDFKCKKCGATKSVRMKMSEIKDAEIFCDTCGEKMNQDWSVALHVPDYMKAGETQEMEWVKDRMKNRPTGRRKVYY